MIARIGLIVLALLLCCAPARAEDEKRRFPVIYLSRLDDPAYVERRSYAGLTMKGKRQPIAGVKTALKEAKILGRAMKLDFPLVEHVLKEGENAGDAIAGLSAGNRNAAFILDLPADEVTSVATAFRDRTDLILYNIRNEDDALRGAGCSAAMFHTIASMAMRTDAIAQYLSAMNWKTILVIGSKQPGDVAMTASFLRSAEKFGLSIAAEKEFIAGNDPREREKNNPKLITGGVDYDAIFVADEDGEFARNLAYQTYLPRPLFGAEGLIASSWFYAFERNGAPQLNQRIHKFAEGEPSSEEWAGWAAVHSVVEAVVSAKSIEIGAVRATLRAPDFSFDLYKVGPGSFRAWDQQLRQALLLHTHNAVVATAPLEGFLHRYNTFDSLGRDAPESECHLDR